MEKIVIAIVRMQASIHLDFRMNLAGLLYKIKKQN
jgi:hypothetical protein